MVAFLIICSIFDPSFEATSVIEMQRRVMLHSDSCMVQLVSWSVTHFLQHFQHHLAP